jgi:16S rRNA G966 N2-methylase RsmD
VKPYYDEGGVTIYNGDCREMLPMLPAVDLVLTDPPYSTGRSEAEFSASGNVAVSLHLASTKAPSLAVFGTSSGRGFEFIRSSIRALPHCRTLVWHRTFTNSPAAGPWRWDLVFIHIFGRGAFGRPERSGLIQTGGTQALAIATGHRAPVPVSVMAHIAEPYLPGVVLDPFAGSGSSLLAVKAAGGRAIGIEIDERYCEIAAKRLAQGVLELEGGAS